MHLALLLYVLQRGRVLMMLFFRSARIHGNRTASIPARTLSFRTGSTSKYDRARGGPAI
jgi:hypothetical protein